MSDTEKEEFKKRFAELCDVDISMERMLGTERPWWVGRLNGNGVRRVVFAGYEGMAIPDWSHGTVYWFNEEWKHLGSGSFAGGYRMFITDAKVMHDSLLNRDVITVRTSSAGPFLVRSDGSRTPAFEQGNWQLQVYAVIDSRIALVRLEDDNGNPVRNSYRWEVPIKGPVVSGTAEKEWKRRLNSQDTCEVLEALVWVSGLHVPSDADRPENVSRESVADAKVFESVTRSPEVKKRLVELSGSEDLWVRELASLALRPDE